jgi:peptide/nickel transport system substrate-binding protein
VLRTAAAAGGGGVALSFLAACGGGGERKPASESGGATGTAGTRTALDPTQGKRGGKIIIQQYGDPGGGLELVKIRNAGVHQLAGFTHDGLLEYRYNTPAFDGYDLQPQPNLAQTMPEQADDLTYVYKLRPAKFHNGRAVTAEDVKYSYELYAGDTSAWKADWVWFEKVEAPDPQTIIVKTKWPYADALASMTARYTAEVLAKEHQESPEAEKKLLGTGPFLFVEYNPPVMTRYKRNPEYHRQPYPYFEEIDFLGTSDLEKKVADFSTHQVHMTYWFSAEERERVRAARPDALMFKYLGAGSSCVYFRTDKPPWNDKRVRQALSMAIDRKALSQAYAAGEGEPDQFLSISGVAWGFRKPKDLGPAAKYWEYNVAEAKKLLEAAGVTLPLRSEMPHWNATVVGQKEVDAAVLIQAQWRNAGIADIKDVELTFGQAAQTISIGNYESMYWFPNTVATVPDIGIVLRNQLFAPPEGIKGPPTLNTGYINNPQLSELVQKQLGQLDKEERKKTFRAIEDILAEEMYRVPSVTQTITYFGDPSVKNMQVARDNYNGAIPGVKYWWFDK